MGQDTSNARLLGVRRRRRLALTPLVDVVFILLIFFILESRFLREGGIDWTISAGGGQPDAALLTLRLFDEHWLWIGDERVAVPKADDWAAFCGRVTTTAQDDAVLLRPGPAVRLQHLVDLSAGLRGCGLRRVAFQPAGI